MDLELHLRVLWRFRVLVAAGAFIALSLAFFSFVRVGVAGGGPTFTYREKEEWASFAQLFVTQEGFRWGASFTGRGDPRALSERIGAERLAEERLTSLAIIYARLALGDAVREILLRDGPINGRIETAPLPTVEGGDELLPLISVAGIAASPDASLALTERMAAALQEFIAQQQSANNIAAEDRVQLVLVKQAGDTKLLKGRAPTLPVVVFLAVMIAVVALVFVLENLRPRVRQVPSPGTLALPKPDEARGTARR
jgi:hypothetical protein